MKIDATTILLIGAGALAIYFITRPTVPVAPPVTYNPYLYNPALTANAGNQTAQDITAGGTAAGGILNALSNLL